MKRLLAVLLSVSLVLSSVPLAFAEETETWEAVAYEAEATIDLQNDEEAETEILADAADEDVEVELLASEDETSEDEGITEEDIILDLEEEFPDEYLDDSSAEMVSVFSANIYDGDFLHYDDLYLLYNEKNIDIVRNHLLHRDEYFTIDFTDPHKLLVDERELAAQTFISAGLLMTEKADEGDYLRNNIYSYSCTYTNSYKGKDYNWYYTVEYEITYMDTLEEEAYVTQAVHELIAELGLSIEDDSFTKIKKVYDYMTENIKYDYDHMDDDKDPGFYSAHSAYGALYYHSCVCQGYSSLFYRVMMELGVPTRIMMGEVDDGRHSWNIVMVGGKYYNIDATWDEASFPYYEHFLRSKSFFEAENRILDQRYSDLEFVRDYKISESDFDYMEYNPGHVHSSETKPESPATCETDGYTETVYCSVCGLIIKASEVIPGGHNYILLEETYVEPTCEENGYLNLYYCDVCGQDDFVDEFYPALGHTEVIVPEQAPTYKEAGYSEYSYCEVCEKILKEKTELPVLEPYVAFSVKTLPLQIKKSVSLSKLVTGIVNGDKIVSWESSNTKYAKISETGKVTAGYKEGTTYITVTTEGGATAKLALKVQKGTVKTTSLKVPESKVSIKVKKTYKIVPVVKPITSTQKVTYSSSNKNIATVSSKGVITGKKAGTAKITVKSGTKKVVITVKVTK